MSPYPKYVLGDAIGILDARHEEEKQHLTHAGGRFKEVAVSLDLQPLSSEHVVLAVKRHILDPEDI